MIALCERGIMRGTGEGRFLPDENITKAQFVTTVVRMIDGQLDESTNPRRENYFQRAREREIITLADRPSFDRPMTMIEVILFMHALKINAIIGEAAETPLASVANEFITLIPQEDEIKAYIDINFVSNLDNNISYLTLEDGTRYKAIRTHIQDYPNDHLARYGTLQDPVDDTQL
jgi:hypothetical protein